VSNTGLLQEKPAGYEGYRLVSRDHSFSQVTGLEHKPADGQGSPCEKTKGEGIMFEETAEQTKRHSEQGSESQRGCGSQHRTPVAGDEKAVSERSVYAEPQMRVRVIRSLLLAVAMLFLATASFARVAVGVRVGIAPPPLPYYAQPICPGDGYLWTPGYWGWDDADYYWVPGTWVMPPEVGFLWTPGYWGWGGDGFLFYDGYWGPFIGFYGGINYGFGYFGNGYEGGRWDNGHFFYNTSVNNVDPHNIHNVYNTRVNEGAVNHVSYNGGDGGINAHATAQEEAAAHATHMGPVAAQTQHAWAARNNPQQKFSVNHGTPPVAATPRPSAAVHPKELPPVERPAAAKTGNSKADQKYQKQQDKLLAKQNQDRQKLQQKQDKEHQQLAKQKANEAKTQQLEQRHQQQTQKLQQTHTQQMQQMQQRQQSAGGGGFNGGGGESRGGGGGGGGRH
jgi:hypothetical protein